MLIDTIRGSVWYIARNVSWVSKHIILKSVLIRCTVLIKLTVYVPTLVRVFRMKFLYYVSCYVRVNLNGIGTGTYIQM